MTQLTVKLAQPFVLLRAHVAQQPRHVRGHVPAVLLCSTAHLSVSASDFGVFSFIRKTAASHQLWKKVAYKRNIMHCMVMFGAQIPHVRASVPCTNRQGNPTTASSS